MALHGPENFSIRELRKVQYTSLIELQLVEQECIKDFGDLNTVYNSRSYEMAGITFDKVVRERKPRKEKVVLPPLPPKEDIMEIACAAEEIPNKKIPIDHFISLFVEEDRNYDKIFDDLTIEGKILVGRPVLEWFGYEGEYFNQKKCFKKMLKNNSISFRELTRKDKEIKLYSTIQDELQKLNEGARACAKFLVMEPDDLKMAIMQLKTKNGGTIRQYYIDLEKLLKLYVEYTLYFNHRESQRKITSLEQMMADMKLERQQDREIMLRQEQYMRSLGISLEEVKDQNEELLEKNEELLDNNKGLDKEVKKVQRKLGIAVEDRAPLPDDKKKQERFVLIKRNDPDYLPYYTIRAQSDYTSRRLRSQKALFPDMEVLLDFRANPNSKTLYVRIKDNLKARGVTFEGNNIDLNEAVTEDELIDEMKVINDQKYDV
jgi:hypothetical protein